MSCCADDSNQLMLEMQYFWYVCTVEELEDVLGLKFKFVKIDAASKLKDTYEWIIKKQLI